MIGGSLALAVRRRRLARRVVGVDRRRAVLQRALRCGAIDRGFTQVAPAVAEAELVVIATPPSAVVPLSQQVAAAVSHPLVLTDTASTKAGIVRRWERVLPKHIHAVGSHPMAGSERNGLDAASAALFDGAQCLMTPTPKTARAAVRVVRRFWRALGMPVVTMSPEGHDTIVAMVSHAPHLLAASLVAATSPKERSVAAMGFSEMTRVALGDPMLWQDICLSNRPAVLDALARVERALIHVRQAIAYQDRAELIRTLAGSRRKRRTLDVWPGRS